MLKYFARIRCDRTEKGKKQEEKKTNKTFVMVYEHNATIAQSMLVVHELVLALFLSTWYLFSENPWTKRFT